jgi:hypothetical protein
MAIKTFNFHGRLIPLLRKKKAFFTLLPVPLHFKKDIAMHL